MGVEVVIGVLIKRSVVFARCQAVHCPLMRPKGHDTVRSNLDATVSESIAQQEQVQAVQTHIDLIVAHQAVKLFTKACRVKVQGALSYKLLP